MERRPDPGSSRRELRTGAARAACLLLLALAWLSCAPSSARAQNPVSWSASSAAPAPVRPGDRFNAQVTGQIQAGWHIYSLTQGAGGPVPTRVEVAAGQPFRRAGAVRGPAPRVKMDPAFQMNTESYEGSVTFTVPLAAAEDAQPGAAVAQLSVRYQACTETICLPPKTVNLGAAVQLAAAAAATPSPSPTPTPKATPTPTPTPAAADEVAEGVSVQPEEETADAASQASAAAPEARGGGQPAPRLTGANALGSDTTLWSFFWLAMTFGALSLLTPCVFPMVPITVSYFTNHAAGDRRAAVRDALVYAAGIILTFTALGVALALLFGAAGINKFAASPWVNLAITAVFLSFALSLFGAYNIQVPSSILTRLDALSRREDGAGGGGHTLALLLMGLTFSLTSFTCTAPFVGTLLVMASQGEWLYPVVGMLGFSTVFALPFFVLALAPQLVSQLPKSGGWLNSVKVVMGLLEVAAAMKFISNVDLVWGWGVFTREVVLASWVAVAALITFYLLGKFQLAHDMGVERVGPVRLLVALASLSLSLYLLTGLFGARLGELESFLPPATQEGAASAMGAAGARAGELAWIENDYEGALAQARREGKLVFIDFTGYTCTNCRWMEANMFPKPEVRRELEKFVRVRLYTDGSGEPFERQQRMQEERFGTVALPLYAVVDPDGNPVTTFPGLTREPTEFVSFLRSGLSAGPQTARAGN